MKETHTLEKELNRLKHEKAALQVQSRLLEKFCDPGPIGGQRKGADGYPAKKLLKFPPRLPPRKKAVCFLLDSDGAVTDSLFNPQRTPLRSKVPE